MKLRIRSLILFALLGITQPSWCDGIDATLEKYAERFENKLDQTNDKLQASLSDGLYKGSTNLSIKLGGLSIAVLSAALFVYPELEAYLNANKKDAKDKKEHSQHYSSSWNGKKLAAGSIGMLIGLTLLVKADSITDYFYKKSV
jgi:hypothetical protein